MQNAESIAGYDNLSEENKRAFRNFYKNFMKGLDDKYSITFKAVYLAKETEYLAENPNDEELFISVKHYIEDTATNQITHDYKPEKSEYKNLDIVDMTSKQYLRVEYFIHGRESWQHIINEGKTWY